MTRVLGAAATPRPDANTTPTITFATRKIAADAPVKIAELPPPAAGSTPLHLAAQQGDAALLRSLLSTGAPINATNQAGATPLHLAAFGNFVPCIKILVEEGADVNVQDAEGSTPLHHAASNHAAAAIAILIQSKARTDIFDDEGFAPLHHSAFNDSVDSLRSLVAHGANIELKDNVEGSTALHICAFVGNEAVLSALLKLKPNISATDNDLATPLHKAAFKGNKQCIDILIQNGASVDTVDATLSTPLHMAAHEGCATAVRCLLDHKAQTNATNKHGRTPLQLAQMKGHRACVLLLSKADGETPSSPEPGASPPLSPKDAKLSPTRPTYPNFLSTSGPQTTMTPLSQLRTQSERNFKSPDTLGLQYKPSSTRPGTPINSPVASLLLKEKLGKIKPTTSTAAVVAPAETKSSTTHSAEPVPPSSDPSDGTIATPPSKPRSVSDSSGDEEFEEEMSDYSKVDKYGFVRNDITKLGPREKEREAKAALKWSRMISTWSTWRAKKESQLQERVIKGIPDCVRGTVWKLFMAADERKAALKSKGEVYAEVVVEGLKTQDARQIDLDIRRTYRNHFMFRASSGVGQQTLGNVLKAYAYYDKEVGYCQGMSSVAALMLMYMEEEDAFCALICLLDAESKFSMTGLYRPGFPKLLWCFKTHETLLAAFLPGLSAHMKREGIETSMYATKWFQTLFLESLPFPVVLRLWDLFLCWGYEAVFAIVLSILSVFEDKLRAMPFEDLLGFFGDLLPKHSMPPDEMLRPFKKFMRRLKSSPYRLTPPPNDLSSLSSSPSSSPVVAKKAT
eukprot:TRINITY_DN1911_c0_g1_i1.p1 TRINITY_DN1911_c0_g1~~TRINITY_DN1911_c0_g1_i1.p1  ORF type:complete len:796 (+),score=150.04 TRINITY_DN1911_c0_g1_i1:791-3178(+)